MRMLREESSIRHSPCSYPPCQPLPLSVWKAHLQSSHHTQPRLARQTAAPLSEYLRFIPHPAAAADPLVLCWVAAAAAGVCSSIGTLVLIATVQKTEGRKEELSWEQRVVPHTVALRRRRRGRREKKKAQARSDSSGVGQEKDWEQARGGTGSGEGGGGGALAGRRMVMPAPRAPVVLPPLLLCVLQAQPRLLSTWASQEGCPAPCSTAS